MVVYIFLAFFIGLFALYESGKNSYKDIRCFNICLFLLLLVVGLRYGEGDYFAYEKGFVERIDVGGDVGYFFLQLAFESLGLSFPVFVFCITLLSLFAFKQTFRLSSWPVFGMVMILGKFFTFYAMSGMRQYIAMAICWWAIAELLLYKRNILFFVMVLFAYTLHGSALIILPVFLFRNIPFEYNKVFWILLGAFALGVFFHQFFEQLVNYSDFVDDRFGSYYRDSVMRGGETMNVLNYFENFLFLFLAIKVRKIAIRHIPYYDFFLYMFVIYCAFLLAGREVGVVKRLRDYYGIAYAFLVPAFVYLFSERRAKGLCRMIFILYFILLMFRSLYVYDEGLPPDVPGQMVPYQNIFSKQ